MQDRSNHGQDQWETVGRKKQTKVSGTCFLSNCRSLYSLPWQEKKKTKDEAEVEDKKDEISGIRQDVLGAAARAGKVGELHEPVFTARTH